VRSVLRPAVALVIGLALVAVAGELVLRALGLGRPILYDNRLAWGFRPLPSQTQSRWLGARVHVNALGVRGPEVGATRAPGATRLLFLGDSVTWGGSYVDDDALFAAVAARRLARDGRDVEWLDALVRRLTARHEAGEPSPWAVDDAPAAFVAGQLRAIVGLELVISRVEAKGWLGRLRSAFSW